MSMLNGAGLVGDSNMTLLAQKKQMSFPGME